MCYENFKVCFKSLSLRIFLTVFIHGRNRYANSIVSDNRSLFLAQLHLNFLQPISKEFLLIVKKFILCLRSGVKKNHDLLCLIFLLYRMYHTSKYFSFIVFEDCGTIIVSNYWKLPVLGEEIFLDIGISC